MLADLLRSTRAADEIRALQDPEATREDLAARLKALRRPELLALANEVLAVAPYRSASKRDLIGQLVRWATVHTWAREVIAY